MSEPRIDRHFVGGDLVVDLGCGDGAWIESAGGRYRRAIGMDVSRQRMASRGEPIQGWEFVRTDLNNGIPLQDSCADAVRANQVIEHVANPLHFIMEAARILRPGGVFIATTPNARYFRHIFRLVIDGSGPMTSGAQLRTAEVWDDGHIHFLTDRDLKWLARTAGFRTFRTEALIDMTGQRATLRRALDGMRSQGIVKAFLTGNVMLVAWK